MGITVATDVTLSDIERQLVIDHIRELIRKLYGFHWLFDKHATVAHAIHMTLDSPDSSARSAALSWDVDLTNQLWKESTT